MSLRTELLRDLFSIVESESNGHLLKKPRKIFRGIVRRYTLFKLLGFLISSSDRKLAQKYRYERAASNWHFSDRCKNNITKLQLQIALILFRYFNLEDILPHSRSFI